MRKFERAQYFLTFILYIHENTWVINDEKQLWFKAKLALIGMLFLTIFFGHF